MNNLIIADAYALTEGDLPQVWGSPEETETSKTLHQLFARIVELHDMANLDSDHDDDHYCKVCETDWPCATIQACQHEIPRLIKQTQ